MKKKIAAMLVIMSLACIQLAGCGQEEKKTEDNKKTETVESMRFRRVIADVSVLGLGREQTAHAVADLLQQLRVAVVSVGSDGAERPFAPEFGLPAVSLVPLPERGDQ